MAVVRTMLAFGTLDSGGQAMTAALDAGHQHICAMLGAGRRFRWRPISEAPDGNRGPLIAPGTYTFACFPLDTHPLVKSRKA